MTTLPRTTRLGVGLMIASLFLGLGIWTDDAGADGTRNTLGRPKKPQGVLARPSSQAGINNTDSSVSKTITWTTCTVADQCTLSFDYLVDSEYGYDQLRVWLDNEASPRFSISGQATGHKLLKGIPSGAHTVRFEYHKDISLSKGADLAWVDNIVARDSSTRVFYASIDDVWSVPVTPSGWTGSGFGNGWRVIEPAPDRSLQRSASQYHSPSTYTYAQRSFSVSGSPQPLQFEFFVDSEPKDFLLVFVNGSLAFQRSGREQHGTAEISLPVGSSTVTFAYQKDSVDDAGLDIATIDNLRLLTNGRAIPVTSFDDMKPGDLPIGWNSSTQPWQVRAKASHVTRLDADAASAAPVVDGTANAGEYSTQATGTSLFRHIYQGSEPAPDPTKPKKDDSGKLVLEARRSEEALYLVLKLKPVTAELGSEQATVTLFFDASRNDTLAQVGCSGAPNLPRSEDRKIELGYTLASGQSSGTVTVTQYAGNCTAGNPWTQITGLTQWSVTAAVAEQETEDSLTLEARIRMKFGLFGTGEIFTSNVFGLGVELWSPWSPFRFPPAINPWSVHLPYVNGGAPKSDDVSTWETVRMGVAGPADALRDGCCSPGISL